MTRSRLETLMKENGFKSLVIVINESDPLGINAVLKGGVLYNEYTGHRIDRKATIWGYITYTEGKPVRRPFKT